MPDIVGSARRTLEVFFRIKEKATGWPIALVAQDGSEDLDFPWDEIDALFIGGSTEWKDSRHAADLVKAGKMLEKHVHVGRVNTPDRWKRFNDIGADTCDGSGIVKYDHMLPKVEAIAFGNEENHLLLAELSE